MLHVPTLLVTLVALTFVTTLLMVGAALSSPGEREVRLWALGNLATCAGFGLGQMSDAPLWIHGIASYAVVGAGMGLVYQGVEVFQRGQTRWWFAPVFAAFGMAGPVWFALVDADVALRLRSASVAYGGACLVIAAQLLRGGVALASAGARVAAAAFGGLGVLLLARAVMRQWRGDIAPNEIEAFNLLAVICCQVGASFGLLLMLENRVAGEIRRLSMIDPLTGLLNRSGLLQTAHRRLERARLARQPVALLEFDVDHFKRINDTYGHPAGDAVLRRISALAGSALRAPDVLSRYGGEEFVALLTDTTLGTAAQIAERLRMAIAAGDVSFAGTRISVTVSVGVAGSAENGYELDSLLTGADDALYAAKHAGRNAVRLATTTVAGAVPVRR